MKKKLSTALFVLAFLAGLSLLLYPTVSDWWNGLHQTYAVASYIKQVSNHSAEENQKLDASYEHLCKMRDELVTLNIVPAIEKWSEINPNL